MPLRCVRPEQARGWSWQCGWPGWTPGEAGWGFIFKEDYKEKILQQEFGFPDLTEVTSTKPIRTTASLIDQGMSV